MEHSKEHNLELAQKLSKFVGARPHQCWHNSVVALFVVGEQADAVYVEGFISVKHIPIEHGWLEIEGRIVDVTLLGSEPADTYYPGVRYTAADIETRMAQSKARSLELPLVWAGNGWGGFGHLRYRLAYQSAAYHGMELQHDDVQ